MRLGERLILGCLVAASTMPCAAFAASDDHSQSMFSSTAILGRGQWTDAAEGGSDRL